MKQFVWSRELPPTVTLEGSFCGVFADVTGQVLTPGEAEIAGRILGTGGTLASFLQRPGRCVVLNSIWIERGIVVHANDTASPLGRYNAQKSAEIAKLECVFAGRSSASRTLVTSVIILSTSPRYNGRTVCKTARGVVMVDCLFDRHPVNQS